MTQKSKILTALIPPFVGGVVGLAIGYFLFAPSTLNVTAQDELDYIQEQKRQRSEMDQAALVGKCNAGEIKMLPSGSLTACSAEGLWSAPELEGQSERYDVGFRQCPPSEADCDLGIDLTRLMADLERGVVSFPAALYIPPNQVQGGKTEVERLLADFGAKLVTKVVTEMEDSQGIKYSVENLPAVLNSPVFAEMLKREIRIQDKHGFCADPESPTCTFGTRESDYK